MNYFARQSKRLATGCQNADIGTCDQQTASELCTSFKKVLAIVEDNQHRLLSQMIRDRVHERSAGSFPQSESRSERMLHTSRVGYGCQLDEPTPIQESVECLDSNFNGQPGFPRATRPDQCDKPRVTEALADRE